MHDDIADPNLRRRIAIANEKAKLEATAANNICVALFSGGVILPTVALSYLLPTRPDLASESIIGAGCAWTFAAGLTHMMGKRFLE
ncbi:hypothetical protein J2X36_000282 [Methylobacterium sp. BE186]|uniref:hypothetical protein n=1 Tax=Methylobacterium sp. BE186 TaxID=2817715 RepID=UPI002864D36F|nr:hypothetical protein [Methylobacterium sp. BE186]MDR7035547.1 hypothetical protein [Methylobacterium sp. BE186]